jgi:hypothetical protein
VRFDGRRYELETPILGWRRPTGRSEARLRVRATRRSDGARSPFRKLRLEVASEPSACSDIDRPFDGDEVEPGEYSVRYRAEDDHGELSD